MTEREDGVTLRALRILIVEDDDLKRRTLTRVVRQVFNTWATAFGSVRTLREANLWMDACPADLVITDWSFPRAPGESEIIGTGLDVVRRCHREGRPVLIASSERVEHEFRGIWLPDYKFDTIKRFGFESLSSEVLRTIDRTDDWIPFG